MMKKSLVAVVIPIYKKTLTQLEAISLDRALKVFCKYDIYAISPESLQLELADRVLVKKFGDHNFCSIEKYNRLMLSIDFYLEFLNYKYILIYQLDAFVFEDKLEYFCSLNYDYIGAPWIKGQYRFLDRKRCIWYVGNGGFSLRNVQSCINVISHKYRLLSELDGVNEDVIFSILGSEGFNVAPIDVALKFSFESNIKECFELNNNRIPMGCHAWYRYDYKFWKPYIESCGYEVDLDLISNGQEDEYNFIDLRILFWKEIYSAGCIYEMFDSRKIYIWGAGYRGKVIYEILCEDNIEVIGFIDSNKKLYDTTVKDIRVYSPDVLSNNESINSYIVVAMDKYYMDVSSILNNMGKKYRIDYCYDRDIIKKICEKSSNNQNVKMSDLVNMNVFIPI